MQKSGQEVIVRPFIGNTLTTSSRHQSRCGTHLYCACFFFATLRYTLRLFRLNGYDDGKLSECL